MTDDTTFPDIDNKNITDISDVTENSLITDFTRVVSCAVGSNRIERRRQKIREELIREHLNNERQNTRSFVSRLLNFFTRS